MVNQRRLLGRRYLGRMRNNKLNQSVAEEPEPVAEEPEPVAEEPKPVAEEEPVPEPVADADEIQLVPKEKVFDVLKSFTSSVISKIEEPVAEESEPVAEESEPVAEESEPVAVPTKKKNNKKKSKK